MNATSIRGRISVGTRMPARNARKFGWVFITTLLSAGIGLRFTGSKGARESTPEQKRRKRRGRLQEPNRTMAATKAARRVFAARRARDRGGVRRPERAAERGGAVA